MADDPGVEGTPAAAPPRGPAKDEARRLKSRALGGVMWMTVGRVLAQSLNIVTRLVLARLLPPEVFGQVAMASVVTVFLDLMTGQGVAAAVVQSNQLDETRRSTAFWGAAIQGVLIAALAFVAAPLIGAFFRTPEIVPVVEALIVGSALLSPASVFEALFIREMDFRNVTLRRIASNIAGAMLAIVLAFAGAGIWALVAQRLLASLIFFALAFVTSPWRPSFTFSWAAWKELTPMSLSTSGSAAITALSRQVPAIAIGRILGAEQLGYYSLAQQVVSMPILYVAVPINGVLYSLFSRLQSSAEEFRRTYERGQTVTVVAASMLPAIIAVAAPIAVPVVLGPQWVPAVILLQILSIPATTNLVKAVVGAAARALGRPGLHLMVSIVPIALRIGGLVVGLHVGGIVAGAIGWTIGALIGLVYVLVVVSAKLGISATRQLRALWITAPSVAALVAVGEGVLWLLAPVPAIPRLVLACAAALAAYAGVLRVVAPAEWAWFRGKGGEVKARFRKRLGLAKA